MAARRLLWVALVLACLVENSYGNVLLSSLPKTLQVTASPNPGQVLKGGEGKIKVTWFFNQSLVSGSTDSAYKTVKVKLCYAPVSQVDRAWRKTVDNLKKDKTCQFTIVSKPYNKTVQSFEGTIKRDVPSAMYFVRAYAFNSDDVQVGYGQTTDDQKKPILFEVQAISGRHVSLDIASICFSAFSIVSLLGFFIAEKRSAKSSNRIN